eukprot:9713915-Prorocentrum_lima.AAC.1
MCVPDRHPDWWVEVLADPSWALTAERVAAGWEAAMRQQEAARSEVPLPVDWALLPPEEPVAA